jgi:nucleoside-diphosphate-sugar epimerase
MSSSDLHVVLGATGGAGNAIVRALHAGHRAVRAVNRSGRASVPEGVEIAAADLMTADDATAACQGAEVVYMAAQPAYHQWVDEFPPMVENVITGVEKSGAKLVMVDNLYSYGPDAGIMNEQTHEQATDKKGLVRRHMTGKLFDAHKKGRIRVAVGRASDYFGPHADNSVITALAIEPGANGKSIRWPGSLDAPHAVAYLPDIARAYALLGTDDRADGRTWILPHPDPMTGRQFLDMVKNALPTPVNTRAVSLMMLRVAAPFHIPSRELLGISYQWTDPFLVDDSNFRSTFGPIDLTPMDEAVRHTIEWYLHRETE